MKCSISPSTCVFPPTYMTTTTILTIQINNISEKCLNYEWRKYANEDEESKALLKCDIYDPNQRSNFSSLLLFDSEYFSFEKKSATVWPKRSEQINVIFNPQESKNYKTTAYLFNKETKERIPYTIIGRGLPSNAEFNISEINVSHVALESQFDYKVLLINKGKIPLNFEFIEKQINNGLNFQFSPKEGYLAIGDSIDIFIHFEANYIGQFKETFNFKTSYNGITGYSPSITFFGRVLGPSYSINPQFIDFGVVGYGFLFTKEFEIKNTSAIPFDYNLILRQDTTFDAREFNLYPDTSLLNGYDEQKVRIEFIPISIQKYDIWLDVHSMKCDDILGTIHIIAECICPKISIVEPLINLETVFIGHQYQTFIKLQNDTDFPAKYEFIEATDQSILDADLTASRINGIIHEHKITEVPLRFKPLELGHINLNRYIKIFGSDGPPLPFTVSALSVGPDIVINSEKINFGMINVLIETTHKFQIFNKSLIPAPFKCEIESKSGVFKIFPEEATIQPNETFLVTVTAFLDDSVQFNGKISLFFQNLLPIYLDVVAKGTGTVIVPDVDMSIINFGYIFTDQKVIKQFTFENQGRRAQEVKFVQQKPRFENMDSKSPIFDFNIDPSEVTIEPYSSQIFTISVVCKSAGNFSMTLPCHTTIQKKRIDLFKTLVKGTFIKPLVSFDDNLMQFNYIHNVDEEEKLTGNLITQKPIVPSVELMKEMTLSNSITNRSELPLEVVVQKEFPFSLSKYNFSLGIGETESFDVIFDPSYKKSFTSEVINKKIAFGFANNPAKFYLNVRANMNFPNLIFSATSIDFGSLLKHTEDSRPIQMTNNGELDVEYEWELTYAENAAKIFDIYPIRGKIEKNKTEESTFSFFAIGKDELFGTAVCHIKGGPEYTINLRGSSTDISFKIEPELIDFGNKSFDEVLTSSLILRNTSTVSVQYGVLIPKGNGFGEFSVHPMSGQIQSGGFVMITVRIVPLVPKEFKEKFFFKIGQFEDAQVDIHVNSCSPQMQIDIPRSSNDLLLTSLHRFYPRIPVESAGPDMLNRVEHELMIERFTLIQKHKKQKAPMLGNLQSKFIVSAFLVDFGNVTLGEIKTKEYTFKSTSLCPFSFDINTTSLSRTGIKIEPTSFVNIIPQSEVKITLIFDSNELEDKTTKEINKFALISFSNYFYYQINIKASISIPLLIFSTTSLEFEQTLVGQSRTQTVQIQNMNSIPIDFSFGMALTTNLLQRNIDKRIGSVFTATPNSETLPPSSFLNVDITFSPNLEKSYQMQFNIKVKNNSAPIPFSLKGSGIQMKLKFEPPELTFDPIQPYGEPSYAEFYIVNPTKYQIEAYLPQFDLENVCAKMRQKYEEMHAQEIQKYKSGLLSSEGNSSSLLKTINYDSGEHIEIQEPPSPNKVTMLSFCIIIHGPVKSGKTTVSKMLSQSLQNIPIISLKEIWQESDQDDQYYIDAFRNLITQPNYLHGFIIDGLDFFQEPNETDQFIVHSSKAKGIFDEISKNPFTVITSNVPTASEKALSLVLSSLNGHYVFMIALDGNLNSIIQHEIVAEEEMKTAAEQKQKRELDEILLMTQDEYDNLPPEKQFETDQKRKEYRDHLINEDNEQILFESTSSSTVFNTGRSNVHSRRKIRENEPKLSMKNRAPRKFNRKMVTLTDPVSVSIAKFKFTLGSISQQLKNPEKPFQVLDLSKYMKDDESSTFITQENILLVDVSQSIEEIQTHLVNSIPSLEDLINLAEVNFIPPPRIFIPQQTECDPLNMPTIFTVVNEEPPGEFPCFEVELTSPRLPANQKKKSRKIVDQSLSKGMDVMLYTKRWILEPNQREKIKVKFTVNMVGKYDDSLKFQIINYRDDVFEMKLHGICDYPEIDRTLTTIFPKIVSRILFKTAMAYVTDIDTYYFGAVLISKERNQRNQQVAYRSSFNLKNTTTFPVEINASLVESGVKSGWMIDNPTITIPPNESSQLTVGFNPTITEDYQNKLIITVKDNPVPLLVNLLGKGCIPQIECDQTSLNFDRILLTQERTLKVELSNVGRIPAFWTIKSSIPEIFSFEPEQGVINTRSKQTLSITFHSTKPIQFKKNLIIDIMDKDKQKVFSNIPINTAAESFDVNFDFIFPKTMDHLLFGSMIVGESKTIVCQMKNKGKYPTTFTFIYAKKLFKKLFQIQPESGTLPTNDKGISVSFTFSGNTNYHYENSKGITLEMKDESTKANIAEIPILFSVDSVYSNYTIDPPSILDFGDMPVDAINSKHITITNHGVFPFDFEISQIVKPEESNGNNRKKNNKAVRAAKSSNVMAMNKMPPRKKSPSMPNMKKKKIALQVDQFSFISIKAGSILPHQSMAIEVDFTARIQASFQSEVLFKIKNDKPGNDSGFTYKLKANTFVPGLVANDFEKIFPSQRLLLRYDLIKNDITSFLEDEKTLHFAPTIVNTTNRVKMALINPYPIECIVDVSIHSKANMNLQKSKNLPITSSSGTKKTTTGGSSTTDSRLRPFSLSKNTVTVQPNCTEFIDLVFAPKKSVNYANMIECCVRGGIDLATNYLKFLVEGRGAVPSVGIVGTDGKIAQKTMNIPFGRTLIGTKKTKTVAIKNFGLVDNSILFATKGSPDFSISLLGMNNNNVQIEAETPILIEHGRLLNLLVSFSPSSTSLSTSSSSSVSKKYQFNVQVTVIDHPKLNFAINFSGESFNEEIVFEGLTNDVLNSNSDLFFNSNVVGHTQSKSFWIRNLSFEKNFRFVWNETNEFRFSPCVGHLHAGKSKQITISLLTNHPMNSHNQQIACKFTHIEFISADSVNTSFVGSGKINTPNRSKMNKIRNNGKIVENVPDWDDSMKTVKFIQPDQIPPEMLDQPFSEKVRPPSDDSKRTPNRARRPTAKKNQNLNSSIKRRQSKAYGARRKSIMSNSSYDEYDSLQQQIQSQLDPQKTRLDPIKVVEMKPEPLYIETADRPKDIPLLVSAISDIIRYQLSTNQIVFNTTMMFDTRYITFDLKNTSSIKFEYTWVVTKFESLRTSYIKFHKVPFSVKPVSGVIEGGSTTTFTVYFTPEEVDDFNAYLRCEIPFLNEKCPEIFLSGFAKRPICHINAPVSDYLSSGRRHSDYTYFLSEDTKVIEIYSSGINIKTYKVFEIINTTEMPYEVFWEEDKVHNNPSLQCETCRAYISSGQHHSARFSYKPTSVKTIESVWHFLIPEHNLKVQVLLVGRIVPR